MRIVARRDGRDADVQVTGITATATARDLARTLDPAATGDLDVGGRRVPARTLIRDAGIRDGVEARALTSDAPDPTGTHPTVPAAPPTGTVVELHHVGGLTAGARVPLRPGSYLLGRERTSDIVLDAATVSADHARLTVQEDGGCTLEDLASHNGTRVDGAHLGRPRTVEHGQLIELGAVQLRLRPRRRGATAPTTPAPGTTRVAFNRPPRPAGRPQPDRVEAPPGPTPAADPPALSWSALLLPLAAGIALAVLIDPRLAAFTLLSPIMVLGQWVEERRRSRRGATAGRALRARQLTRFRDDLADAAATTLAAGLATTLDPAEAVTRATTGDVRLWERRLDHPDVLRVRLGLGPGELSLPVDLSSADDDVLALARAAATPTTPTPVAGDLRPGRCLGIVGDEPASLAVLRWTVAATAIQHGPADVRIAVVTDRPDAWAWAAWLPHTADPWRPEHRLLAGSADEHVALLDHLASRGQDGDPVVLLVLDAAGVTHGRGAVARDLLRGGGRRISGVVRAARLDELPEVAGEVLTLDGAHGRARWSRPATGDDVDGLVAAGIDAATALAVGRSLAGLEDPDARLRDGDLPARVDLLPLLGLAEPTAERVRTRWGATGTSLVTPLGATVDGVLDLDLRRDGPHGLIGGTTGSGKSELLRTLVAGLAATTHPDHLNLVLIDYKGGSAFDACADLPHTVGVVTDLDDHLAARALTCLEAELRWRERRLRTVGAEDVDAYHRSADADRLPRLLVVVDEFAALATELPDFVAALVDVAQRGRSLGVHLLLATQRPSGVVSDHIRTNTNLRLSLRVPDATDSTDVLRSPDAAGIRRDQPGRGYARLRPSELVSFQTALVTGTTRSSDGALALHPLRVSPTPPTSTATAAATSGPTDLERLVAACRTAAAGLARPRRPWPQPLPTELTLADLGDDRDLGPDQVTIGLADEPDAQQQVPLRLDLTVGSVAIIGGRAAGTDATLATIALRLAAAHVPDDLHLHVLDLGAGRLAPLADLPHVGAYIGHAERERQERLLRWLTTEVARRRGRGATGRDDPRVVVLLHDLAAFAAAYDDLASFPLRESVERAMVDGPSVGITTVLTADRPGAIPAAVASSLGTRLVGALADPLDRVALGLGTGDSPPSIDGRAVEVATGREVQIARAEDLASAVATITATARRRPPVRIGTLPERITSDELAHPGQIDPMGGWRVVVGIADDDLRAAELTLGPGDHALVAGPARSGRSSSLATLARAIHALDPTVTITAVVPRGGPLLAEAGVQAVTDESDLADVLATLGRGEGPQLVLVDDVELIVDPAPLDALLRLRRPDLHVVAAGRVDVLRSCHAGWLAEIRRTRLGLALRPNPDTDGLLWEATLPRRGPAAWPAGRGYLLAEGASRLVQVARA